VQGQTYVVEVAINIANPQWQSVTQLTGNGGALTYTEPAPLNNGPRFFRIRTN
jgi:hypothetical protein